MKLQPIQKKKRVYQDILDQIRLSIENRELKPGDKLPSERDLADLLSVSRTAVREAISVLEANGFVRIQQGMGVFLKEDEHDIMLMRLNELIHQQGINLVELLEVRQGIEGQGAYLAALRRTEHDLHKIKQLYDQMKNTYDMNKPAAEEDYEFHLSIAKASQNSMLVQHVNLFSDKFLKAIKQMRSKSIRTFKSQEVLSEHFEIYKAIEEQEPDKAQKAMWNHLRNAIRRNATDQ